MFWFIVSLAMFQTSLIFGCMIYNQRFRKFHNILRRASEICVLSGFLAMILYLIHEWAVWKQISVAI